jgi:ankyrin repeat protein
MNNDMEVVRALLAKGASPNVNAMGLTAFLVAAGVGTGNRGGTGLAAAASAGGNPNSALMDLLIQHGADVNAQVTGTKTYSMRIARAPSANEGMTALHVAAQAGRLEMVRYLLDKGANSEIADINGRKPVDLAGSAGGRAGAAPAAPPAPAGRGPAPASSGAAEIRALLQSAAPKK